MSHPRLTRRADARLAASVTGRDLLTTPEAVDAGAVSKADQLALNKGLGDAWRDQVAGEFDQMPNRMADIEVTKMTPFGLRRVDVEVSDGNGQVLGGIETKFAGSPYTVMQQWKDMWLWYTQGYRVDLVRYAG